LALTFRAVSPRPMNVRVMDRGALQAGPAAIAPGEVIDLRTATVAAVAAIVAVAVQALWIPIDADVSWLITVSEKVLSGDRLYVDIIEVNPPASVWLYVPLVWAAEMLGARPEAVVAAAFLAAGLVSVAATVRLASRLDESPSAPLLTGALAFIALVLPMGLFAQREHAALLLALPAMTCLALVAAGKPVARNVLAANGLAAGLLIVLKPHFALAIAAAAGWALWKRRTVQPFLPAMAAAALAVALYAAAVLAFARPYFDLLPSLLRTYVPMHGPPWKILVGPAMFPAMCLGLALLVRRRPMPPLAMAWFLASAGFVLAAVAQAKNYPNHWLPGAALATAAAFALLAAPGVPRLRRLAVGAWLGLVVLLEMYNWAIRPDPAVASAIRRVAPPAPKVIALSPQLVTGHPVTRNVGGTWVGSRAGLYAASGARFVGLDDRAARQAYRDDIQAFVADVQRHSPDVVLVFRPSKAWLLREPAVARAMSPYAPAARAGDTEVWVRRDSQPR